MQQIGWWSEEVSGDSMSASTKEADGRDTTDEEKRSRSMRVSHGSREVLYRVKARRSLCTVRKVSADAFFSRTSDVSQCQRFTVEPFVSRCESCALKTPPITQCGYLSKSLLRAVSSSRLWWGCA